MRGYVQAGYAFDLEENEEQIRCIAAPIRDVAGRTIAAISVSSAAQYMSDHRMQTLSKDVMAPRTGSARAWVGRPSRPAATSAAVRPGAAPAHLPAPQPKRRGRRRDGVRTK